MADEDQWAEDLMRPTVMLRQARGTLTLREVSECVGVSFVFLWQVEEGVRFPTYSMASRLAHTLNMPDYLAAVEKAVVAKWRLRKTRSR